MAAFAQVSSLDPFDTEPFDTGFARLSPLGSEFRVPGLRRMAESGFPKKKVKEWLKMNLRTQLENTR